MKITWFGASQFRLHYGGQIVVLNGHGAENGADAAEIVSGADRVLSSGDAELHVFDASLWTPAAPVRPLDMTDADRAVRIARLGAGFVLESRDEPLLAVLEGADGVAEGRWADDAVLIAVGAQDIALAAQALEVARPKQLLLALDAGALDDAIAHLRPRLGRAGLIALDPALAIEI